MDFLPNFIPFIQVLESVPIVIIQDSENFLVIPNERITFQTSVVDVF